MNILESITAERRGDAEQACSRVPPEELLRETVGRTHRSLADRLRGAGVQVVAEVKKASPSAGLLRPDYRPAETAAAYARAGAAGISVLTEPRHFLGSLRHLAEVRAAVDLPLLRKDFISHPYQVAEAVAHGADVILLIVAALDDDLLRGLYEEALRRGLEVLAEAHCAEEIGRALALEQAIVGVNSRNLKTLRTDLDTARGLARLVPADRLSMAESGIKSQGDIRELAALGYDGFLVGESLLASHDPGARLAELLGNQSQ